MIDAGIYDGDIVVIRQQNNANNGDIVVALVEDQDATLKKLHQKGNIIELEAAIPNFKTQQFRIVSKLLGTNVCRYV